jgi:hypothetical protein
MRRSSMFGRILALAAVAGFIPHGALAATTPSGERTLGQATIEPAYDDATGGVVYLLTPNRLAPLGTTNSISNVDPHSVAPLFLIVYPPGTAGTFDCMGVPGNCPDHGGVIAGLATSVKSGVYGTDPSAVPGHDHLVGVARTGGDFNAPWHVYVELFTSTTAVRHITTIADLQQAWASGTIDPTTSGLGIDTGITFLCSIVSAGAYMAATPVSS